MKKTALIALLLGAIQFTGDSQETKTNQMPATDTTNSSVTLPVTDRQWLVTPLSQHQSNTPIDIPTGGMMWQGGQLVPEKKTRQPAAGNTFLVIRLEITNPGSATRLSRQQVALLTTNGISYTPFYWENEVAPGLVVQGNSFNMENSIRIDALFDVPTNELNTLTLSLDSKHVGLLSQFPKQ
jgi:hypothetical protein